MMNSPTPAFHPSTAFSSSTSSTITSTEELDLPTIYDHQRKYISTLTKQLPQEESTEVATSNSLLKDSSISSVSTASVLSNKTRGPVSQLVTVNAPNNIKLEVEPQGPFRFQPAPAPSSAPDWDETATDIFYSVPILQQDKPSKDKLISMGILLVAFADGRVDVCLDLIKVEAVWTRPVRHSIKPFIPC
jgi:nucleoporin NUP82